MISLFGLDHTLSLSDGAGNGVSDGFGHEISEWDSDGVTLCVQIANSIRILDILGTSATKKNGKMWEF